MDGAANRTARGGFTAPGPVLSSTGAYVSHAGEGRASGSHRDATFIYQAIHSCWNSQPKRSRVSFVGSYGITEFVVTPPREPMITYVVTVEW